MKTKNLFGKSFGEYLPPMHHVCSNDDLRPNMQCVHIENGIATATNGYALVRYDLKEILEQDVLDLMEGKLIHKEAWKLMCANPGLFINVRDGHLTLVNFSGITGCHVRIGFVEETYPDFHNITHALFSFEIKQAKELISFNAKQFEHVTKVLNHNTSINDYRFWFNQGNAAIVITNADNDNAVAILMPVMFDPFEINRQNFRHFIK